MNKRFGAAVRKTADEAVSDLKVSALLIDGNYELVDVGDELVTLSFPQSICTFLQKLHEDILRKDQEEILKQFFLFFY